MHTCFITLMSSLVPHSVSLDSDSDPEGDFKSLLHFGCSADHRIRSIQNDQQAIRHSSVIFVAPYWQYRISCLKVQLAPLAQDADSEKWNISLDLCKKGLSPDLEYFRLQRDLD